MEAKEKKPFKVKAVCTTCGKEVPLFQNDRSDESACSCDKQDCDIEAVKIRVAVDHIEPGPPPSSEKAGEASSAPSLNFKPNLPQAISPATASDYFVKPGYKLVTALGEGSMGSAFKVHSESLNKEFVVKKLNPILSENPRTAKRWRLSGSEIIQLSHPNMESIYEVDIAQDGSSYMVTEAVEGEPLAKLIQREGFMEAADVVEISKQVCEALAYVHENDVLHRGINPRNIFLTKSKEGKYSVKLTDCGTARAWPSSGRETRFLLSDGKEFGDPRYMSPEQCSGQRLTESADIYSFGCVMYEALGGKPPFSSRNPNQTAVKQLTADIRPLSDRFRDLDIPTDLEAIVMKALQKDPIRRYKSAKEMLRDLETLGTQKGMSKARSILRKFALPDWMKGELDLRKLLILFTVTAILSAFGGLYYSTIVHRDSPTDSTSDVVSTDQTTKPVRTFLTNTSSRPSSPRDQITVRDINGNEVKTFYDMTFDRAIGKMVEENDDLQKLDFHGADLRIHSLTPLMFYNTNFDGAHIHGSELRGSGFADAKFVGAKLQRNHLENADFVKCRAKQAELTGNNLTGANLSSGDFEDAVFRENHLLAARARNANFGGAQFNGDYLENADLTEAQMNSATFTRVSASRARFYRATLDGINCTSSYFPECNFEGASIIGASLERNTFVGSNFSGATLENSDLSFANLTGAIFKNANLSGTNFSHANLSGCDFSNADLSSADLTNADLTNAKLDGANLTDAKIDPAMQKDSKSTDEKFKTLFELKAKPFVNVKRHRGTSG